MDTAARNRGGPSVHSSWRSQAENETDQHDHRHPWLTRANITQPRRLYVDLSVLETSFA